jgi:hypothetical protein
MANSENLINCATPAPYQYEMSQLGRESTDYYFGRPYPKWAFGPAQWPREKGPTPTPMPLTQILVDTGAQFLIRGGAPRISVAEDPKADELLQAVITSNRLQQQFTDLAVGAALCGSMAIKFSVDLEDSRRPVRITLLSVPDQARFWFDPHDSQKILMARIQYPYRDNETGNWMLFREEWTDASYVSYKPKFAASANTVDYFASADWSRNLGDDGNFEVDKMEPNVYGLIPISLIRNKTVKGNPLGLGDCWTVFRLIDRISLTMHGEDKQNQIHSEAKIALLDARLENEGPLQPGEPLELISDGDGRRADIKLVEPSGAAREWAQNDVRMWTQLLYHAVGLSLVDSETVSNKGNLTALAFTLLYDRSIATSNHKRENFGAAGLAPFFSNMLLGLNRLGGIKEVAAVTDETAVNVEWPDYFQPTASDLADTTSRTINQVNAGLLPHSMGAERLAISEKIPPSVIDELLVEVKADHDKLMAQKAQEAAQTGPGNNQNGN